MKIIYAFSDTHLSPEGERPGLFAFLEEAAARADLIIGVGDIFDLARFPMKAILAGPLGKAAVCRMKEIAEKKPLLLIDGNHDFRLSRYCSELGYIRTVGTSYETDGTLFIHGHWEFDWSLSPLFPIYGWLFPLFPRWAFIYDRLFPTPSQLKRKRAPHQGLPPHGVLPRYYEVALFMHYRAMLYAMKHKTRVVFGHTHLPEVSEVEGFQVGNCGDDLDSHTGLILGDGEMKLWRLKNP